jgi:hypothetical protein
MDIKLVNSELKIRLNSNYSCEEFYKYVLSQTHLLKQIRQSAKYEQQDWYDVIYFLFSFMKALNVLSIFSLFFFFFLWTNGEFRGRARSCILH